MRCEPASVQRVFPISLAHDLADGTLVHWGDVDGPEVASWALYLSRRLLSARVSAFLDFLKQVPKWDTGRTSRLYRQVIA
jgi:hypothetical protein